MTTVTGNPRSYGDDEWQETIRWDHETDSGLILRYLPEEGTASATYKGERWANGDISEHIYDPDVGVVLAWLKEA